MTLDFLAGSYKLYKDQTAKVLSWLTETGTQCNVRPPRRGPTASSTTTTTSNTGSKYIIDVNDIVPFARLVVDASQKPVKADVLDSLRQAIMSRRRFTRWYQSQSNDSSSLEQSNEGHRHFNRVLEELLDVLAPFHSEGEATVEPVGDLEGHLESATAKKNPFDILEVESSDIADLPVPLPKPDCGSSLTETTYQSQDSTDDIRFLVFTMLEDFHRVRKHIHECLERYRTGNLTLVCLSAIINCAIGIVRGIERDFMDSMPQFASWEKVMDTIVSPSQFERIFGDSSSYSETAYLRSLYCLPFEELRRFRDSIVRGNLGRSVKGHVMLLRVEVSQLDNEDTWEADKIILHELLTEFLSLGRNHPLPSEDELTGGIVEVFGDKPVHLWVVFGLQIFLDTQHILGEEVTRPFREFRASSNIFKENVEHYIKYSRIIRKRPFDQAEQDSIRKNSAMLNKWTTDDMLMRLREKDPQCGLGRPFFFLSHNPVVCGLMQSAALLKLQSGGIKIMNTSIYAASAAHLYNAARTEGCLPSRWPDMETLIDFYGRSDIFLGAPPKSISAYSHHHLVARGASATNFAKDKSGGFEYSDRGARELKVPKIMETMGDFLCQTDATRTDINVDLMEKFLHQTAHRQAAKNTGSSHRVSPLQLLILLERGMEEEEAKLVFNYYALHYHCWMLLFKVYMELRDEFTAWLPSERRNENPNLLLHILPPYIFGTMSKESGKKGGKKGGTKGGKDSTGEENILSRVGRVMDAYISEKAQHPSPATVGVVDDSGLKTEIEHGTQNGVCIHWGTWCDRLKGHVQPEV